MLMRTNIEMDDDLLEEVMALTGHATQKATVDTALRQLRDKLLARQALLDLGGAGWDGDLDEMRRMREFSEAP